MLRIMLGGHHCMKPAITGTRRWWNCCSSTRRWWTPLKNGHVDIVKLLLPMEPPGRQSNIFGLGSGWIIDSKNMKSLLLLPEKKESSSTSHCSVSKHWSASGWASCTYRQWTFFRITEMLSELATILKAKKCWVWQYSNSESVLNLYCPITSLVWIWTLLHEASLIEVLKFSFNFN